LPTWGELLKELKEVQEHIKPPFDFVRRKYLSKLHEKTGRDVILYASKWTSPGSSPGEVTITEEDLQGLMEVIHGLTGPSLDLIIHSPGGSAEVTEALVAYIRTKFTDVRAIVPQSALSAATMLACSANKIVMGKHSFLGPIDPQFIIETRTGVQRVPAQAILDQFDKAKVECQDPKNLGHWLPILEQYGPALLVQCENALELSRTLLAEWLERYMFKGDPEAFEKAKGIADYLSNHKEFKSHGKHISRDILKAKGLKIEDLETDQELQDLVLSVFHATTHTFTGTGAVKIIENHNGKAFIKAQQTVSIEVPVRPASPSQPS
jgi:hypothetical protein